MPTSPGPSARPGSVGQPVDEGSIEVRDEAGRALGPGEVGTVYFRAPTDNRFEYFRAPDKTASAYDGAFFTLGDHGHFDAAGHLFLTGRSAEVVISGGVHDLNDIDFAPKAAEEIEAIQRGLVAEFEKTG